MPVKVININSEDQSQSESESWLDHWKKFSRSGNAFLCSKSDCFETPVVGAHVHLEEDDHKRSFVIPLCDHCRELELPYNVDTCTEFIPLDANNFKSSDILADKRFLYRKTQ